MGSPIRTFIYTFLLFCVIYFQHFSRLFTETFFFVPLGLRSQVGAGDTRRSRSLKSLIKCKNVTLMWCRLMPADLCCADVDCRYVCFLTQFPIVVISKWLQLGTQLAIKIAIYKDMELLSSGWGRMDQRRWIEESPDIDRYTLTFWQKIIKFEIKIIF